MEDLLPLSYLDHSPAQCSETGMRGERRGCVNGVMGYREGEREREWREKVGERVISREI